MTSQRKVELKEGWEEGETQNKQSCEGNIWEGCRGGHGEEKEKRRKLQC